MTRVAIIHPTDLVGNEIKDQLARRDGEPIELTLLTSDEDEVGQLTDFGGAAAMVQRLDPGALEADVVFACGPIESYAGDLSALSSDTELVLLSSDPGLDEPPSVSGVTPSFGTRRRVSPHPAVVHLALLLARLLPLGLRGASASVVQSTSIFGSEALDELMEQTRKVLSFHTPGGGEHFDRQVVFNLFPAPDDDGWVEAQLVRALDGVQGAPRPAVQLLQGGIFHGLAASLLVELDTAATSSDVTDLLLGDQRIELVDELPPGPVEAAASDKVLVAPPRPVSGRDDAFWLWSVMDNLTRGSALHAIELAGL